MCVNYRNTVEPWTEEAMAPHSSILAWKLPWTEEPGRLQSMGSLRVGHDWVTSLSLFTFLHWRRKWQPTALFLLENPGDGGAWWAAVYGVAQSRTRLKWLSSSSSGSSSATINGIYFLISFADSSFLMYRNATYFCVLILYLEILWIQLFVLTFVCMCNL